MKKLWTRLLAMLLTLCMALTLLPLSAFAATEDGDSEQPGESASEQPGDGALLDEWAQDPNTVRGTGSICEIQDGRLHLKADGTNTNNGGTNANPPAMFVNKTMNAALAASDAEEKTLSFDVVAVADSVGTNPLFGLYFNYKSTATAVYGEAVCVDTNGAHWFHQDYYSGATAWGDIVSGSTAFAVGTKHHMEFTWTDSTIKSFKLDDAELLSSEISMSGVVESLGQLDTIGFKVGCYGSSVGDFYITNLHYTGQQSAAGEFSISGTVSNGTDPVAGASVKLTGGKTPASTTTNADGEYEFAGLNAGEYTIAVSAESFNSATASVTVSNKNEVKDIALARIGVMTVLEDGVTEDEWKRDPQTDTGKTDNDDWLCELEDGQIHLKSGPKDGNGSDPNTPSGWPGVFYNETANDALAAVPEGENRWMEITFVRAAGSTPRFGFYFNYGGPCDGYFIGCNSDTSGWFWQNYCPGGTYGGGGGSTPAAGVETTVRAEWNDTKLVSFQVNGQTLHSNLDIAGSGKGVALRLTSWGDRAEYYIKSMHYSGQPELTVYAVSGTVKYMDGTAVEGAAVVAGSYSATTDANGKYSMFLPDGEYTVTASKENYADGTKSIEVDGDLVAVEDIVLQVLPKVSGDVTDAEGNAVPFAGVALKEGEKTVKASAADSDGHYEITGVVPGTYTAVASAEGYVTSEKSITVVLGSDLTADLTVTAADPIPVYTLSNSKMTVEAAQKFPQVIKYTLSGGKVMYGQTAELNTLKLNGVNVVPKVTSVVDGKTVTYTMTVDETNNGTTNLNVVITARIVLGEDGDNTLAFHIDKVEYTQDDRLDNPLQTIEIPNHSLVSVRSTQTGAAVTGGKSGGSTYVSGDATYFADKNIGFVWTGTFFAGFVYNDEMSAGLASNSEVGTGSGGSNNYPVRVTFEPKNNSAVESIALDSAAWYWDRKVSSVNSGAWENEYITKEQSVVGPEANEIPYAKVVITADDENGDEKMDWQDGAIVYRDTIMHMPANSELVRDAVSMRITLNFGGQAQNPFLITLDNVKRVALSTDGLGQMILLKGYASEGHDSGHPDYWNIGERMGGVKDFNTMLVEGAKLGAQFGIHVNASEFYPEAQAFNDKTVGRYNVDTTDSSGVFHAAGSLRYGWNWIDQGVNMNVLYDFASGNRAKRFDRLYKLVGNKLTFIYVDVWGNNQHAVGEDAWMTRKLTNEIVNKTGWRIAHEWSFANPYDSTFQHWTSDYTYGNYTYKGYNNSNVMRFLLNSYKDSFPADFATFGGACNAPLLGGPSMQGFEGWQKDDEYDLFVENTFNQLLVTKFLQHYDIMQWVNADNKVSIPYNANANGARSSTGEWTPEMQIKLSDGTNNVVVTRGLDGTLNTTASFSLDKEVEYRSRVITLNGKVILTGAPASAGEDKAFPASKATQKYLIPWYWDADGKKVAAADEKLYHWNAQGGTSTWELPDSWAGLETVIYYELSDQGRGEAQTLTVSDGTITFPAAIQKNTAYVVVKGAANKGPQFEWSTGLHVKDASFNVDFPNDYWKTTGSVERVNNPGGISALHLSGKSSVSQVMTDLVPGQKYVTYVGVDNLSTTAKASITITDQDGKVLASNYTKESIAVNYISGYGLHTAAGLATTGGFRENRESRFQNMYIFFTPEAGKTYTMTLSLDGEGDAYFDDVRTLETEADNFTYDSKGNVTGFFQDFEHVAQGEYPFVVGPVEGVEDNRQHLSELHAPYTQAGWDVKMLDDVIDGKWSIKVNGLSGQNDLVMQTIPQNFRFEPDKDYIVTFDYEIGTDDSYQVVVGDGKWDGISSVSDRISLKKTLEVKDEFESTDSTAKAAVGKCTFLVTGSESGQTWIGIYSYKGADTQGASGNESNFGGYKDFVLDNLSITPSEVDRHALNAAIDAASAIDTGGYVVADGVNQSEDAVFAELQAALAKAMEVQEDFDATQDKIDAATKALTTVLAKLAKVEVTISGTVTDAAGKPVAGATITLEDSNYIPVGNAVNMPGSPNDGSANGEGEKRTFTWYKGLTATTDAEGKYSLQSTDEVALSVQAYKVKVQANGYEVDTADVTLSKTAPNAVTNVTLTAKAEATYTRDFDDGDVSMMNTFDNWIDQDGLDFGVWIDELNGSKAAETRFRAWNDSIAPSLEGRKANNLLAKDVTVANGTISFDVTLPDSSAYFGLTLRGASDDSRIYIGADSDSHRWFVEWWNDGDSYYTSLTNVPIALDTGVTRHVSVTLIGPFYSVKIDGITILEGTFTDGAPMGAGYFGINARCFSEINWNHRAIIDNIYVVSLTDASVLQALYDKLKDTEQGNYSDATFAALTAALEEAEKVLAKENATVAEINAAYDALLAAWDALELYISGVGRPESGTTVGQPFPAGTGGSTYFRIPAMVTLSDGTLVAASDARWNHAGDACALDTVVSISKDNGKTWTYSFVNYFNDSTDAKHLNATAFIDPVMVRDNDDNIYLVVDLFPGGIALNTAPAQPDVASGYVEIDGVQRMAIYSTKSGQTDDNYTHYVGDFVNGYAPILVKDTGAESGYYVDDHYYLYQKAENGEMTMIYCEQLGSTNTHVQQNVFYYNADLHVRNATYLWMVKSTDGGKTWSAPKILNPQVRTSPAAHQFYGVGPGAGLCLDDGTIMIPCYTFRSGATNSGQFASFIYSTDGGETWTRSENATSNDWSSESCLVQIDQDMVRHFYRDGYAVVTFTDHTRDSSGVWHANTYEWPDWIDATKTSNSQLSAISYSKTIEGKQVILVSTAASGTTARTDGRIYTFLVNDDKTLTLYHEFIVTGEGVYYCYSSLTELADGSIGLLYEDAAASIVYKNYTIAELTGAEFTPPDTPDVPVKPNNPVPSNPNNPVPSNPNNDTKTEVKENEDGTTTTIVTDNKTGTVTETTEKKDGTVEVVETKKDGTVTETTTDPEGGKVEKVTTPDEDVTITVTDAEGEVLAKVELPGEIPAVETRFVDVPEGHWADEAIHNMAALEVVNGVGGDRFDMNGGMTRGALATVLSRLSNGQEGLESSFADVTAGKWYADGIAWAARTGVVTGYSATEFGPEDIITREQLAVMLCRYARLLGMDTAADSAALDSFTDGSSTHSWAADSIAWCVENGILNGMGNGTLAPTATATRAQVAVMLQRFIDLMK